MPNLDGESVCSLPTRDASRMPAAQAHAGIGIGFISCLQRNEGSVSARLAHALSSQQGGFPRRLLRSRSVGGFGDRCAACPLVH